MYYFKVKENEIFKYEVLFSVEKIKKLQRELVNNCAIEEKYDYISYGVPFREKELIIKNLIMNLLELKKISMEIGNFIKLM